MVDIIRPNNVTTGPATPIIVNSRNVESFRKRKYWETGSNTGNQRIEFTFQIDGCVLSNSSWWKTMDTKSPGKDSLK